MSIKGDAEESSNEETKPFIPQPDAGKRKDKKQKRSSSNASSSSSNICPSPDSNGHGSNDSLGTSSSDGICNGGFSEESPDRTETADQNQDVVNPHLDAATQHAGAATQHAGTADPDQDASNPGQGVADQNPDAADQNPDAADQNPDAADQNPDAADQNPDAVNPGQGVADQNQETETDGKNMFSILKEQCQSFISEWRKSSWLKVFIALFAGSLFTTIGLPVYQALSPHAFSTLSPLLDAEHLITTRAVGEAILGERVKLECEHGYRPSVKEVVYKVHEGHSVPSWSAKPACILTDPAQHHPRSAQYNGSYVNCTSTPDETECIFYCRPGLVPAEENRYRCTEMPCRAWTPEGRSCYTCDKMCDTWNNLRAPTPGDLLATMLCNRFTQLVVRSLGLAGKYQGTCIGVMEFVGESQGSPIFENTISGELLHRFSKRIGAPFAWYIGPNTKEQHAGITVYSNATCPENIKKGTAVTYLDDDTVKQLDESSVSIYPFNGPIVDCKCPEVLVTHLPYSTMRTPELVKAISGRYRKDVEKGQQLGFQATLYFNEENGMYLYSFDPQGQDWRISYNVTADNPLVRLHFPNPIACPDDQQSTAGVQLERYNENGKAGEPKYIEDGHFQMHCNAS